MGLSNQANLGDGVDEDVQCQLFERGAASF